MALAAIAGSAAYVDWNGIVMRRGEELCAQLTPFKLSVTATSWPKRFIGYDCQILHRCQINFDILYLQLRRTVCGVSAGSLSMEVYKQLANISVVL